MPFEITALTGWLVTCGGLLLVLCWAYHRLTNKE
jgi:hypothetical protein